MEHDPRIRFLRIALVAVGLIFLFGVYPMMMSWWPSGWRWQPNQPEYEQMILGVYRAPSRLGWHRLRPYEVHEGSELTRA